MQLGSTRDTHPKGQDSEGGLMRSMSSLVRRLCLRMRPKETTDDGIFDGLYPLDIVEGVSSGS